MTKAIVLLTVASMLTACTHQGSRNLDKISLIDCSPSEKVSRSEALQIAECYRSLRWLPSAGNVFHGLDPDGIRVDTPDITLDPSMAKRPGWWTPGSIAEGVPYQWGGFDSPESFLRKVGAGYFAGDVYRERKRELLYDAVSRHACGIDCSGFISRCWRLEKPLSTRQLPEICLALASFDELEPADIVNKTNVHALLFVRWLDSEKQRFLAYETGSPPSWKVLLHSISVDYVKSLGYLPYR